jgi:hypothetical protein
MGLPCLAFSPEETSDTLPIDLNSAALGVGRHVSGIAVPFDEPRIAHGWIKIPRNNMSGID